MKYIKTYEAKKQTVRYWKVKLSEPEFSASLYKLKKEYGCDLNPTEIYHIFLDGRKSPLFEEGSEYVYIINKDFESQKSFTVVPYWYWSDIKSPYKMFGLFTKSTYMGEVEVSNEDIKSYYVEEDSKKYNI